MINWRNVHGSATLLGAFGACRAADASSWVYPLRGPQYTDWTAGNDCWCTGWSPCGQLYGILVHRRTAQINHSQDTMHGDQGSTSLHVLHVFDRAQERWLPELRRSVAPGWEVLHGASSAVSIDLSWSPSRAAVAVPASRNRRCLNFAPHGILIVWLDKVLVQVVSCVDPAAHGHVDWDSGFMWLPGGHSVILAKYGRTVLAAVELDSNAACRDDVLQPQWVAHAAQRAVILASGLAVLPSGLILLAQVKGTCSSAGDFDWACARLVFLVFDSQLAQHSISSVSAPEKAGTIIVSAFHSSVAVGFSGDPGMDVYEFVDHALGRQLCAVPNVVCKQCCFSPGGQFVASRGYKGPVSVYEVAEGKRLASFTASGTWAGLASRQHSPLQSSEVIFAGPHHSQLHTVSGCYMYEANKKKRDRVGVETVMFTVFQY